jgi:hypothetical protein
VGIPVKHRMAAARQIPEESWNRILRCQCTDLPMPATSGNFNVPHPKHQNSHPPIVLSEIFPRMEDFRIMYLKYVNEQRIANSAAATAAFTYVAVVGLATEKCTSDSREIKVWLFGVLVVSILQVIVRIAQSKFTLPGSGATRAEMVALSKGSETLDVICSCWFIVGHFLLLETYRRRHQYPFMYFLCWQYILSCYVSWSLHHLVEFSLYILPPFSADDRRYWQRLQTSIDAAFDALPEYMCTGSQKADEQRKFWMRWLQSYNCYDLLDAQTGSAFGAELPSKLHAECPPDSSVTVEEVQRETYERTLMQQEDAVEICRTLSRNLQLPQDDLVCNICLCSLFTADNSGPSTPLWGVKETTVCGASVEGEVAGCSSSSAVVRYPCVGGRHYFHFDCLCTWMVRASVCAVDIYGGERVQPALCPCCRQPPSGAPDGSAGCKVPAGGSVRSVFVSDW